MMVSTALEGRAVGKKWIGVVILMTIGHPVPEAFAKGKASGPSVDQSLAPYASQASSVRLPGNRSIHFTCAGHGSPTVILIAGGGGWGIHWNKVQPAIAAKTRVCAWDRAGFGFSGPSPVPQTLANRTSDLEIALARGGIPAPYIVVGHSAGAYESLLLTDREPTKVVGMVLVDPSVPDQPNRFRRATPAISATMGPSSQQPVVLLLRKCAAGIRAGAVRPGADPDHCLTPPPFPPDYPQVLRVALTKLSASATPQVIASVYETIASSDAAFDADSEAIVSSHRAYGSMPLTVLTAGEFRLPANASQAVKDEVPARQADWRRAHDEYAALSRRGENRIVAGSGHIIQWDKPQAVINAVIETVKAARATPHPHVIRRGG
jgi:pimeloyl-ACP methyl ester carboxylesterase